MNIRRSIVIVAVLILLFGGGFAWIVLSRPSEEPQTAYSLSEVKRGDIVSTVSATGSLSPVITVQVGSQVSGTIQHLYVDFNSRVKKGDLIAQIDPALFKARLAEAEANFKSAIATREKAWVGVLDAQRQLERLQKQQKQKLVSESDVDAARFAYDAAVVEHKIKTAAADQAKAARDREKVNLAYTSIFAPIDGVVISRNVDVGQTVAASLQAPTLFTIAQDLTRMQIETEVDEAFIGMIEPDQPVHFSVFAYQKRQFNGQVAQVRLNPTIEAGVVKYNCIILVDNQDLALKPGMTATVTIEVARSDNVLKVPNSALRYVPDWPAQRLKKLSADIQSNEGVIWLPQGDDVKPLIVVLGTTGEKETQISGEGVKEGMPLVVPASRKDAERKRRFGLSLF
ncbi:MAG: efflux RND transporter periplasmic adaptor subunit [Gammaproteobacteria bacterium]|jgi:HlyD family secretion protein